MILPRSIAVRQVVFDLLRSRVKSIISVDIRSLMSGTEGSGIPLSVVVSKLEEFANPKLAEGWDNVGLLVEPTHPHCVSTLLLTNDLTLNVLEEAVRSKTDLIISYHPPIFAPLKRITQSSWKEKLIVKCLEERIAVYSPHTAWDAVSGGVSDSLASAFNDYCESIVPLVASSDAVQMYDVITSSSNLDILTQQFSATKLCSMNCESVGKKMYRVMSKPHEASLISSLPDTLVSKVDLLAKDSVHQCKEGMGRLLNLKAPGCTLSQCVQLLKSYTGLKHLRLATAVHHTPETLIKKVALVPGSGGSLLKGSSADLYVTGEMFHHDLLDANHRNVSVILTNHSDSERPFLCKFKSYLATLFPSINIIVSSMDRDPVQTV